MRKSSTLVGAAFSSSCRFWYRLARAHLSRFREATLGSSERPSEKAGLISAKLMADGKAAGQPRSPLDMIIASIAVANDCFVVTDTERDHGEVEFINPMRAVG